MAISKRLRYEILRRDDYTCRYCRTTAPGAELTVDHVVPVTLGGSDDPSNLAAACKDCNNGKTSSSPDAPLVADVAQQAVEWARAMRDAQARMLADLRAREADRRQFAEWWDDWGEGGRRPTIPMSPGWTNTVDQLIAAGLPLPVLQECIRRAMTRKQVADDQKFRYMCGVAWKKLTELQNVARQTVGAPQAADDGEVDLVRGRAELARELLGDLDEDHREALFEEAREDWQARTDDEMHVAAAHIAWQEIRTGLSCLAFSVCGLLPAIPDEVMQSALRRARAELYDENGEEFSRHLFAERVASIAMRGYEERAAAGFLAALSSPERDEWTAYANALYAEQGGPPAGRWAAIRPAWLAKNPAWREGMCGGRGEHIPWCPSRATCRFRFTELKCCAEADDDHDLHEFCDRHSEIAMRGGLRYEGAPVTVRDWRPMPEPVEAAVPF